MTDWKSKPHLFTNRKFKALCTSYRKETDIFEDEKRLIIGHDSTHFLTSKGYDRSWFKFGDCQLIARPIESMMDEEIEEIMQKHAHKYVKEVRYLALEIIKDEIAKTISGFIDLSNVGVYPFDQSDFENGFVINANEIEEV